MADKPSKAELGALRVQAAAAKVAAIEAATAQSQLIAQAKLAGVEAANSAKAQASALAQQAAAAKLAGQEAANAAAAQKAAFAQAKAQQDAAAAQIKGMAAMSKMLNDKHLAEAKAANLAAKTEATQAKAAAQAQKAAAAQAKATAATKDAGATAQTAAAGQASLGQSLIDSASGATQAGGVIGKLQGILSKLGPEGEAAAIAIGVLTIAVTAVVGALTAMAAAAIEVIAQRSQLLATFSALSGGAAGGAKTLAIVEKLGTQLPFATAKIAEWAKGFQQVGFQGKALENALKAVGAATALMGESGGAAAQHMIEALGRGGFEAAGLVMKLKAGLPEARSQLAEMGLRVEDVAGALGMTTAQFRNARLSAKQMAEAIEKALAKKAAGPLGDLMLTWPNIIGKAKEGFMSLFDKLGPAVKPFMSAVKNLFGLFNKGGAATSALKPIVTAVFTTLFSWATKVVTAVTGIVKAFSGAGKAGGMFSGVVSVAKGVFAILMTIGKTVAAPLMAVAGLFKLIFSNALVLNGLKTIFTVLAAFIGSIVVGIGLLVGAIAFLGSMIASAIAAVVGLAASGVAAAVGFIDGLVNGITGGAGGVIGAITNLASSAVGAFKAALGIASPSKVMMQMGGHTAAGFGEGVDDGAGKAQESMQKMVNPSKLKVPAGGGKGGGSRTIDLRGSTFIGCTESQVRGWIIQVLDAEAGAGPEPEPA